MRLRRVPLARRANAIETFESGHHHRRAVERSRFRPTASTPATPATPRSTFRVRRWGPRTIAEACQTASECCDPKHYGSDAPLAACEFDAADMTYIARSLGYDIAGTLLSANATRQAVIDSIRDAANGRGIATIRRNPQILATNPGAPGKNCSVVTTSALWGSLRHL